MLTGILLVRPSTYSVMHNIHKVVSQVSPCLLYRTTPFDFIITGVYLVEQHTDIGFYIKTLELHFNSGLMKSVAFL